VRNHLHKSPHKSAPARFAASLACGVAVSVARLAAAADASEDTDRLEEVVVTAQKRVESLQNVPVSVQVIGGQMLVQQNQISLETLTMTVPAVHIAASGPSHEMYIRGIGSGQNQSFDQSVGTFIDDIYHGRSRIGAATFLDLERIEVLKGPQSTFFGNNAIAGALNIVTRKPTDTFDASARALYGSYGEFTAEGAVGGPITDQLSARAAATYDGVNGWIKNVTTGEEAPRGRNWAGRLTLAFKPTANLDSLLKLESSKSELRGTGFDQPFQIVNCPPPPPIPPNFAGPGCAEALAAGDPIGLGNNRNAGNAGMGSDYKTNEGALTVNYQLGGHTFTSVTGYYQYDFSLRHDNDGTSLQLMTRYLPESYHQFSQEVRVASPTDQPIEWLAGAYVQTDRLHTDLASNFFFVTPFFPPGDPLVPYLPLGLDYDFRQKEDMYSTFGSATWKPTDRLRLSAGVRGSWVKKDYDLNVFYGTATQDYGGLVPLPAAVQSPTGYFGQGVPGRLSGNRSDHAWMPSARAQFQLNHSAMVYASYARGFKSGGFNGTESSGQAANVPFNPEYVNAYEVGLKSEWLDSRLLLNLAIFRSNYSDLQVAFWDFQKGGGGAVPHIRNAAKSKSQGVEVESRWVANQYLRFSADITYLDARFVSYRNAAGTVLEQFNGQLQDLSGARTQFSPDWSGSIAATFTTPVAGLYKVTTELSPYFTTGYHVIFLIDKDFFWQDPYVRLDGRLSFEPQDGHWAVDLIGKNLTDRTIITAFGSPYQASKQEPRNVAVQFRFHW
jgi:iron complex outermembrane receptor protein